MHCAENHTDQPKYQGHNSRASPAAGASQRHSTDDQTDQSDSGDYHRSSTPGGDVKSEAYLGATCPKSGYIWYRTSHNLYTIQNINCALRVFRSWPTYRGDR